MKNYSLKLKQIIHWSRKTKAIIKIKEILDVDQNPIEKHVIDTKAGKEMS